MNDIFISYAREDRISAKNIAIVLEKLGWSVWWDNKIPVGKTFREVIESELKNSRCVIVLWSNHSVKSDFVKDEADVGKNKKILIPVLIEECKIPLGFRQIHALRMQNTHSNLKASELTPLSSAITTVLNQPFQSNDRNPINTNQPIQINDRKPINTNLQNNFASKPLKNKLKPIFALAVVIGIVTALLDWYLTLSAGFQINTQVLKFTDPIIIKSGNSVANKHVYLNVQFDGRLFIQTAIPQKSKENQVWHFWIKDQLYSPEMIKPGKHKIKVGFPDDKLSEEFVIEFIRSHNSHNSHNSRFIILNPILRPDEIMKIKAGNNDTNIKEPLYVEFDSVEFPVSGIPVNSNNDMQTWHCNLLELQLTEDMIKDGKHKIRFRFTGGNFSEEHIINFLTQVTLDKSQVENNNHKIDVFYHHEGSDCKTYIPIIRRIDESTGNIYYVFETSFSGFPEILLEDEKYNQTFFELRITDIAGNQFFLNQSYNQFIASGSSFLSTFLGDIKINRKFSKKKNQANRYLTNIFTLYPNNKNIYFDSNNTPFSVSCNLKTSKPKTMSILYPDGNDISSSIISKDEYSVTQKNDSDKINTSNNDPYIVSSEQFAILTLRSNVRNDTVFIDGQKRGPTRIDEKLPLGKHIVRVEKMGYKPFEQTINLKNDKVLWANLELLPGSLQVTTKPERAVIYLKGKKKGISPAKLKGILPGSVEVIIELDEYKKQKKTIQIQPGKVSSVHFDLIKQSVIKQ